MQTTASWCRSTLRGSSVVTRFLPSARTCADPRRWRLSPCRVWRRPARRCPRCPGEPRAFRPTKSRMNQAAVMDPPARPPMLWRSAKALFSSSLYSSSMGMCQVFSPSALAAASSFCKKGFVVGEGADVDAAESHHNGAGQCCGVHQMGAAQALGVSEGVDQDQPAFGVGVQHLDGFAGERCDDIAGPLRFAAGHVFDGGHQRGHRDGGLSCAMARMAPSTAAPPAMSYLIFSMPSDGLMEMPPVSKVTPLPDQAEMILRCGSAWRACSE